MPKLKKYPLLFIFGILLSVSSYSQTYWNMPEVLDFDAFEARVQQPSDTLYIYNFWATWCRPCVAELPYFEKLGKEYAEEKVKVVLVSLDWTEHLEGKLIPFMEKKEIASKVILLDAPDYNDWIDKVSTEWSGAIPATLITLPDADIYEFKAKEFEYEELDEWVRSLLTGP